MRSKRDLVRFFAPALLLCLSFSWLLPCPAGATSAGESAGLVGKKAPFFTAADVDGSPVILEGILKSSVVVIVNFWGIRCSSCLEEMPYLMGISDKYSPRGVRVLGINIDGLDGVKLKEMLPKLPVQPKYSLVCDPDFRIVDLYGASVAPLTLVMGPGGVVTFQHEGFSAGDEKALEEAVVRILNSPEGGK